MANKNQSDLRDSFTLLNNHLEQFYVGENLMYRPIAVELRKILCETNPSPLLTRVLGEVSLLEFHHTELFNHPTLKEGLVHFMPGSATLKNGEITHFKFTFRKDQRKINVTEWVQQMLFTEEITVYELIRSVANKEGAHSDPKFNPTLLYTQSWSYGNIESHILGIIAIAEYLTQVYDHELRIKLSEISN